MPPEEVAAPWCQHILWQWQSNSRAMEKTGIGTGTFPLTIQTNRISNSGFKLMILRSSSIAPLNGAGRFQALHQHVLS